MSDMKWPGLGMGTGMGMNMPGASMEGLAAASQAMRAVSNEMMAMSMDSLRRTTGAFEQMQKARDWTEILRIQTEFFQGSFQDFTSHSRRIAELAASAPGSLTAAGTAATEKAVDATKAAAESVVQTTKAVAGNVVQDAQVASVGLDPGLPPKP